MESNFAAATAPHPNHLKRNAARTQPPLDTTPVAIDNTTMIEIVQSDACKRWLARLRDRNALARIQARLLRIAAEGHFGDVAPVSDRISEIRIDYGPGYRIYYLRPNDATVVLLYGGDKDSQQRDIPRAQRIAPDWR